MIDHWSIRVHRLVVWVMMELILPLVLVRDDRTVGDISMSDCIPLKIFVCKPIHPIGICALHVNIAVTNRYISAMITVSAITGYGQAMFSIAVKNSLSVDSHTHMEYLFISSRVARSRTAT